MWFCSVCFTSVKHLCTRHWTFDFKYPCLAFAFDSVCCSGSSTYIIYIGVQLCSVCHRESNTYVVDTGLWTFDFMYLYLAFSVCSVFHWGLYICILDTGIGLPPRFGLVFRLESRTCVLDTALYALSTYRCFYFSLGEHRFRQIPPFQADWVWFLVLWRNVIVVYPFYQTGWTFKWFYKLRCLVPLHIWAICVLDL